MRIKHQQQGLLPILAYTSQAWFQWEMEALWGKNWHFAGMVSDLGTPGDYMTVQVGVYPIFVVRGHDHRLRAFHNICRHRGTQLLRAKGKSEKNIVCPYHNWTYSLNGALKHIPERHTQFAGQQIDMEALCLFKASVQTWREMIFVHPDPNPEPFMAYLGDVPKHVGPHQVDKLVESEDTFYTKDVKCNWKILVENAIDGYHLDHLHPNTLNMYNHKKQDNRYAGKHWVFREPLADWYKKDMHNLAPYGLIDHIPEEKLAAYLYHLFPSVLITETEGSWSTLQFIPQAPDRTVIEIRTRTMPLTTSQYTSQSIKSWMAWGRRLSNAPPNDGSDDNMAHENDPLYSGDFMEEDIFACEQQQKAMSSPLYSTGPVARDEESIFRFHEAVLQHCPLEEWESRWRSFRG